MIDIDRLAGWLDGTGLRANFRTDADGRYWFRTVRPLGYSIPMDGPVGAMVRAQNRHGFRPSHIHFLIGGEGYRELVTALYFGDDEHIDSDTVFGVSGSLVVAAKQDPNSPMPELRAVHYDFRLAAAAGLGHDHAPGESEAKHLSRHHGIASLSFTRAAPVAWPALSAFLAALAGFRGADLLRIKGIVNVAGRAGPVVIQGVQHLFHPPLALKTWPDEDRRSRLVFITRNLPAERLAAALEAAVAE